MRRISKEGLHAPLFLSAVISALLLGASVNAQTVELSDLEICADQETEALKLACFNAIVAAGRQDDPPAAENADDATERVATTPEIDDAAEIAVLESSTAIDNNVAEFGDEQLTRSDRSEDKKPDVLHATVVEVTRGRSKKLTFHFSNGHVWRQREPTYIQYPKGKSFDVVVRQGLMGGYRLRVGGKGRMTRIVRIR